MITEPVPVPPQDTPKPCVIGAFTLAVSVVAGVVAGGAATALGRATRGVPAD